MLPRSHQHQLRTLATFALLLIILEQTLNSGDEIHFALLPERKLESIAGSTATYIFMRVGHVLSN